MPWLRVELSSELLERLKKGKGKMTWEQFFELCLSSLQGECDLRGATIELISSLLTGDEEALLTLALGLMLALEKLRPNYSPEISQIRALLRTLIEKPEEFDELWNAIVGRRHTK